MCVHTNQEILLVAKKDITVYKIIKVHPAYSDNNYDINKSISAKLLEHPQDYKYKSLYLSANVDSDCVENEIPYKADGVCKRLPELNYMYSPIYKYRYAEGLIHGFRTKKDANFFITHSLSKQYPYNLCTCILYKCIIPKGTKYLDGIDDEGNSSYAAKTIVFKEPVWFGKAAKEWFDKNDFKK